MLSIYRLAINIIYFFAPQILRIRIKKNKEQPMAILIENKLEHTAYYTEAKKWELED